LNWTLTFDFTLLQ